MSGQENNEIPNEETLKAFEEIEDMKRNPDKYKGYNDIDQMIKDICA